jgi:nitrogen regulatory protein PII
MSENKTIYLTDLAQITCVVQEGLGEVILQAARNLGVSIGAITYHSKGTGMRELFGLWSVALGTEKDVVSILVANEQKDMLFDALYQAGELDLPGKGFMYVTQLDKMATFLPENVLNSLSDSKGD